ncbi:hypothetical protein ACSDR0_49575 [Streptosporangium sp. G11]|uniref:hypothetical protein n=1 Tax=Streptosporangium sp. G11 TaxID=3436926 RepID=UPI003EC0ECAD
MKAIKKLATVMAATAMVAGLLVTPATASASSSQALGCQAFSARALLYWGTAVRTFTCSGTYNGPFSQAKRFRAGGWSGYLETNIGTPLFCDGDDFALNNYTVYRVVLYATKASWC